MAEGRAPLVAGLGGAALVAALMSAGVPSTHSDAPRATGKPTASVSTLSYADLTSNQEGPWYAFCQEYATTEFDHGEDPAEERGISGHHVPMEAEEGTVEITRHIPFGKGNEDEKFNVKKHTVGDLASCVPKGVPISIRVIVATVPDPNATQMQLEFDRDIDAIQAAAAAEHYTYTRFWFPWIPNGWAPAKDEDAQAEAQRRTEPGILCFRKANAQGDAERLFVLLVGETPTSGIQRLQFAHALAYDQQLGPWQNEGKQYFEVAGPHFSASFEPIQDVLSKVISEYTDPYKPLPTGKFISPDASGSNYLDAFWQFCKRSDIGCQLTTLNMSSKEADAAALKILNDLGYDPNQIAELGEDESAFGDQTETKPVPLGTARLAASQPTYGLVLKFPRDLSSLRGLSDAETAKLAEAGSKYLPLSGTSTPTVLAEPQPVDRDSPQAFGAEQETVRVSRSLANSVEEMRKHAIRAVVIEATNPLDRIYLLVSLRKTLPSLRVVTIDADALELDHPQFVDLTGTIAVTNLPVLTGMTVETMKSTGETHTTFESSRQEGEDLSVAMFLEPPPVESPVGKIPPPCYHYSVVGNDGLQLLPDPALEAAALHFPCEITNSPSSQKPPPLLSMKMLNEADEPWPIASLIVFVCVLFGMHLLGLRAAQKSREGMVSYVHKILPQHEPSRQYLLFVVNNQVLLLILLTYRLAYASFSVNESSILGKLIPNFSYVLLPMALLLGASLSAYFCYGFVRSTVGAIANLKTKCGALCNIAVALIFLLWSAWMIFSLPSLHPENTVFLNRLTHLTNGLSPVLPIVAILSGYYLWGWVQLRRLGWAASRQACFTLPGAREPIRVAVEKLQAAIGYSSVPNDPAFFTCLAFAVAFAAVLYRSFAGFDGDAFRIWFVVWGVVTLLLTVMMTCYHSWLIWDRAKRLLASLEATPMAETFKRLGEDGLLKIKIWDLTKTQKSFTIVQRTVESMERLYGSSSVEATEARNEFTLLLHADIGRKQLEPEKIEALNAALNVGLGNAVSCLQVSQRSWHEADAEWLCYLAFRLVALVRYAMLHLGILVSFVAYGFVLAVISVMFYPFAGKKLISELLVLTFVILILCVGSMMVEFQRNAMLSRLEGSLPGQVSYGQLLAHLFAVCALPLLAILTSQLPGLAGVAYTLLRPLAGIIR